MPGGYPFPQQAHLRSTCVCNGDKFCSCYRSEDFPALTSVPSLISSSDGSYQQQDLPIARSPGALFGDHDQTQHQAHHQYLNNQVQGLMKGTWAPGYPRDPPTIPPPFSVDGPATPGQRRYYNSRRGDLYQPHETILGGLGEWPDNLSPDSYAHQALPSPSPTYLDHSGDQSAHFNVLEIGNYASPSPSPSKTRRPKRVDLAFRPYKPEKRRNEVSPPPGERPICEECNKDFVNEAGRRKHERSKHNSDRQGAIKHKCLECSKPFAHPKDLRRHIKTHSSLRPFVCPEEDLACDFNSKGCVGGFKRVDHLVRHVVDQHEWGKEDAKAKIQFMYPPPPDSRYVDQILPWNFRS